MPEKPVDWDELFANFGELPSTPLIRNTFDYARHHCEAFLCNHVARSWIFAVKLGAKEGLEYDPEVVAVATLLHDLGLTEEANGPHRFEVNGANVARDFLRTQGLEDRKAQLVWDSIALHATPSISVFKETEVALTARAIGVDFGAPGFEIFSGDEIDAITTAVPRLNLKQRFSSCLCHLAEAKPETTYDNIARDFGERFVEGYQAPSWVDRVLGGPYAE